MNEKEKEFEEQVKKINKVIKDFYSPKKRATPEQRSKKQLTR